MSGGSSCASAIGRSLGDGPANDLVELKVAEDGVVQLDAGGAGQPVRRDAGADLTESRAGQVRLPEVGAGQVAARQGDSPQGGAAEVSPAKIAQLEVAAAQGGVTQTGPAKRAPGEP